MAEVNPLTIAYSIINKGNIRMIKLNALINPAYTDEVIKLI